MKDHEICNMLLNSCVEELNEYKLDNCTVTFDHKEAVCPGRDICNVIVKYEDGYTSQVWIVIYVDEYDGEINVIMNCDEQPYKAGFSYLISNRFEREGASLSPSEAIVLDAIESVYATKLKF